MIAESGLTYDKEFKTIDMGKSKANYYKFNQFLHLSQAESVEKESRNEIRKSCTKSDKKFKQVQLRYCRYYREFSEPSSYCL